MDRCGLLAVCTLTAAPQHVDIAHWAGLGGVRYIPADFVHPETEKVVESAEQDLALVNQRNMELVGAEQSHTSSDKLELVRLASAQCPPRRWPP